MDSKTYEDLEIDGVKASGAGGNVYVAIEWSSDSLGFGVFTIEIKPKAIVSFDIEMMSEEFCSALMTKFIKKYYKVPGDDHQ